MPVIVTLTSGAQATADYRDAGEARQVLDTDGELVLSGGYGRDGGSTSWQFREVTAAEIQSIEAA